jgi:hypothetical protein
MLMGANNVVTALAFTLLFGLSNGLVTIARGDVPLVFLGQIGLRHSAWRACALAPANWRLSSMQIDIEWLASCCSFVLC